MSDSEEEYVGSKAAGAATFHRLIEQSVEKLFRRHKDEFGTTKVVNVAFVDVINQTDRELGATRQDMIQVIETKINHFPGYKTVSSFYVGKALTETRLVVEDLFLKAKRDQFLRILEREKNPAEALLFAMVTSIRTIAARDTTQVNYRLTMELVDTATGENFKESTQVRKAYTK